MIQELELGYTLLVRGPTRITLLEGEIEVFGKKMVPKKSEEQNTLIIPSAQNYPLYAVKPSKLDIGLPG